MNNVEEKLDTIADSGWVIAYDGCHKIYLLDDDVRAQEALSLGYNIYSASLIRELWEESCGLRFVSRWGLMSLGNEDFEHELNISQFEDSEEDWLD